MPLHGKTCWFLSCASRSKLHPDKKFHPFVKPWADRDKCLRWIVASGRNDISTDNITKHSYVCSDHFVNGRPSLENPDPLPHDFLARVDVPDAPQLGNNEVEVVPAHVLLNAEAARDDNVCMEDDVCHENQLYSNNLFTAHAPQNAQVASPVTRKHKKSPAYRLKTAMSPARRAALLLKKKAISPRKMHHTSAEIPFSPSSPIHELMDAHNKSPGKTCDETPSHSTRILHRRLFEEHMEDIMVNDPDTIDGISPLIDSSEDRGADNASIEKVGKVSVATQTLSQSYIRKLIAKGALWTPNTSGTSRDDSGAGQTVSQERFRKAVSFNIGGEVSVIECDDDVNQEDDGDGNEGERDGVNVPPCINVGDDEPSGEGIRRGGGGGDSSADSGDELEDEMPEPRKAGKQHRKPFISFEVVTDDTDFKHLCGLSKEIFDLLYRYIGGDEVCARLKYEHVSGTPRQLRASKRSYKTRLFLTLCRLRRGFSEVTLAVLFGCSESLVSRIVNTWINFLYLEFKPLEEEMFQDRSSQRRGMPKRFKSFKNLRVIVDCTEIKVETPSNFQQQGNTCSSYKHSNTVKYLIGINCRGAVIYVSEAFEGSMSDKEVFMRSSLYEMLIPGDVVMADRGFDIAHELDLKRVKLIIPSYLKGRDYLTPEEEIWSKKVARARIFVENAIGRIKTWRILNGTFPQSILPVVSQMVFVCACLTNFLPALI